MVHFTWLPFAIILALVFVERLRFYERKLRGVGGRPGALFWGPCRGVLDELHSRDQRPVELSYPLAPELFELRQAPLALPDELGDVYA